MAEQGDSLNNKKKLTIIIALIVLLVIGGAAAWFFMLNEPKVEPTEKDIAALEAKMPALYLNLPQPFIFNVTGDKRDRLVQLKVQVVMRGTDNETTAIQHTPLIESVLLSTFAAASVEQLREPRGRIDLREQATRDIQDAFTKITAKPVIEKVLFTDFVMQ
ncbi:MULTISPECIES: flagellar basal body-associated protein FliL [unclassified Aliivibrio]|jgi:flagellar FliL protein|uniref:flagellar basal body-associated protein FliL n=1 Tax=unclassified Aliivibrio TaxID=2645654 RepID=UPI00080E0F07|nr:MULTISPECIES: flagellar basal body-associated protein FliL [unclassified Aliivibrio]OCH12871.1 flagellar basal body-associated protein FliL [Aliivibrio sp. 1S165]OCH16256.1 flagellar basal body-associated protein FliL [Aliivibrio sp. 1S128]OCH28440.1 flagellar basal body-associated protein FliL [Aliivibrio sp. 1S175]